ncbi:hypothetical protein ZIOFF_013821 [Zingiber officinale]|uniref:EXS domain-containing protein n=1 Tax=Zingiber officinale TaxID=94328 RepID=A0A8J5LD55_ZINOF|nr:hypothetical protein ZIOFF_013821 [Zingiber officinale]
MTTSRVLASLLSTTSPGSSCSLGCHVTTSPDPHLVYIVALSLSPVLEPAPPFACRSFKSSPVSRDPIELHFNLPLLPPPRLHLHPSSVCRSFRLLVRLSLSPPWLLPGFGLIPVVLFLLWGITCCKIGWDSVMRMNADKRDLFLYETFLYFNPLLLVTLMVWLWGVNLWVFSQSSVNYSKVFDLDHTHLTHREIWKVFLYAVILMVLIFPFEIFYLPTRYYLLRTIVTVVNESHCGSLAKDKCTPNGFLSVMVGCHQVIALDVQAITFSDFFVADIMTSMSKVFSDLERSVCRMVNRQVATIAWFEADSVCGSHSVAIPIVLVFPYMCRFFQCLRQYKDTKERTCLFNALKYATAVPVIFLSALKYHVFPESWTDFYRPLWLISSVINSLYSFYWDVTRDWDLSVFTRIFKFKNPHICTNLLYGRIWVYYWVMGSNLVLRCTWTYKLSAHLRHNYLTVFTITALEIMRRFQWIFFRVENEWNKMTGKASLELSAMDKPIEEERLLGSASHNV